MKEATRQGDVRHAEDYNDLPENIKEFDRALARFILYRERLLLEKIGKPLREAIVAYPNHECMGCRAFVRKIVDEALAIIKKEGGE